MLAPQARIILSIGDDGVVAVPYRLVGASPFFIAGEGRKAADEIARFVAQYPHARLTLFADNLAQDYRADTLPPLSLWDRTKLARRRVRQSFPAARLATYLPARRTPHQILMIGLHESNPVFVWAERLRDRLPDIALLPAEGARIARRLMPEAGEGWAMTVSRHRSGGFRQIVTYKSDLVFTRLTPLPEDEDRTAEAVAGDIKASLDYLARLGLRGAGDLSVLLLLPGPVAEHPAFGALAVRNIASLSPFLAAQKLGLPFASQADDECGDLLFAASLLTHRRPALTLMLPEMRRESRARLLQRWGLRGAAGAMLLALLMTGWKADDLIGTLYKAQREAALTAEAQHKLADMQHKAAPVTEPLGRLRQAIERRRLFRQDIPEPWPALDELADALGDAKIDSLQWSKPSDAAPETLTIGWREMPRPDAQGAPGAQDRAATVAAFDAAAQDILRGMPDFKLIDSRPPYPALPQDSISVDKNDTDGDPLGKITLQRDAP